MSELLLDREDFDPGYYDALSDREGENAPIDRFGGFVVGSEVQIDHKRQIEVTNLTPGEQQLNIHVRHNT